MNLLFVISHPNSSTSMFHLDLSSDSGAVYQQSCPQRFCDRPPSQCGHETVVLLQQNCLSGIPWGTTNLPYLWQ